MLCVLTGHLLMNEGYLQEIPVPSGFGATIDLTERGISWLNSGSTELILTSNGELLAQETSQLRPELVLSSR